MGIAVDLSGEYCRGTPCGAFRNQHINRKPVNHKALLERL